jgi:hypothetical protein
MQGLFCRSIANEKSTDGAVVLKLDLSVAIVYKITEFYLTDTNTRRSAHRR